VAGHAARPSANEKCSTSAPFAGRGGKNGSPKEIGMKRLTVLGGTFLMVFSLAGCGGDPREEDITSALNLFDQAAANLRVVKTDIANAVTEAVKNNKTLTEKDFKKAEDNAKKLRGIGKQLLEVKGDIEILKEGTSGQAKERYSEEHREQLARLFAQFQKEEKELNAELARAALHATPAAMEELRRVIRDSREEFLILTKPR
jgi:hypothetical protein